MNFNARAVSTASALTIAATLVSPAVANAQYGSSAPPPSTAAPSRDESRSTAPAKGAQRQLKLSEKAQPAIIALQTAVKAKNAAAVPGLSTAAQAVAKTPDDRYAIGTLLLQAAIDANDSPGLVAAADLMSANGAPPSETTKIYLYAAQKLMAAKQLVLLTGHQQCARIQDTCVLVRPVRLAHSVEALDHALNLAQCAERIAIGGAEPRLQQQTAAEPGLPDDHAGIALDQLRGDFAGTRDRGPRCGDVTA